MLNEESEEIKDAIKSTMKLMEGFRRGDICPWGDIEKASGFPRYSQHWGGFVQRLKKRMMKDRGIVIWPVRTVGFELLTVEDQLGKRSRKRRRRAIKQLTRDIRELASTPAKEMTQRQREEKVFRMDQTRAARKQVLAANRADMAATNSSLLPRVKGLPIPRSIPSGARPMEPAQT